MKKSVLYVATIFFAAAAHAAAPVIFGAPYPLVLGKGGIKFKNSDTTTTCNAAAAGSIRYNAGTFQVCDGASWTSLGASGANTTLSNLGTTAINADLLFDTDQNYNIGSGSTSLLKVWTNGVSSKAAVNLTLSSNNNTGDSGSVVLNVGTSGATRGKIKFVDGSEGTSGNIWTSTDTNGNGHWATAASGGTTYTANQYGLALSSATNSTLTILAPSASTTAALVSGGASANPQWAEQGSMALSNCSLAASVASHALTVSLKDAGGSTPSASSPCIISFRNSTATTGSVSVVTATAATSVVVSNGSQIGCPTTTVGCYIYVYALNNAGTVELALIGGWTLDEAQLWSTTAEGGAGAADAAGTFYSTTSRANVAVRKLGRIQITPAASFAWDNAPGEIDNVPFIDKPWYVWVSFQTTFNLSASTQGSSGDISKAGVTVTTISSSAPAGTCCTSTNACATPATGVTTCGAGNPDYGIDFVIPASGIYEVCFFFNSYVVSAAAASIQHGFIPTETATNSQTAVTTSGTVGDVIGASMTTTNMPNPCGIFDWTGSGAGTTKAVRLNYQQTVSGTISSNDFNCDNTQGGRLCYIRVRKL